MSVNHSVQHRIKTIVETSKCPEQLLEPVVQLLSSLLVCPPPDGHDVVRGPAQDEPAHQHSHDLDCLDLGSTNNTRGTTRVEISLSGSPRDKTHFISFLSIWQFLNGNNWTNFEINIKGSHNLCKLTNKNTCRWQWQWWGMSQSWWWLVVSGTLSSQTRSMKTPTTINTISFKINSSVRDYSLWLDIIRLPPFWS